MIIVLGPLKKHLSNVGGAVVFFTLLNEVYFKSKSIYKVIDINYFSTNKYVLYISTILKILLNIRKSKSVILFVNSNGIILYGLCLIFLKRVFNFKIVLRPFGGGWYNVRGYKGLKRKLILFVFRNVDLLYFQTSRDLNNEFNIDAKLLSNGRSLPLKNKLNKIETNTKRAKIIYIGRIDPSKGINLIIELFKGSLNKKFTIDMYGSINDRFYTINDFENIRNLRYKGYLNPDELYETIVDYDFLIFPSLFKGEGVPGVILESIMVGVPVITTNINGVDDVIVHKYNGLIYDGSFESLKNLLETLDLIDYQNLVNNALESSSKFDVNNIVSLFEKDLIKYNIV